MIGLSLLEIVGSRGPVKLSSVVEGTVEATNR